MHESGHHAFELSRLASQFVVALPHPAILDRERALAGNQVQRLRQMQYRETAKNPAPYSDPTPQRYCTESTSKIFLSEMSNHGAHLVGIPR